MSRLYSSPEVTSLESLALNCPNLEPSMLSIADAMGATQARRACAPNRSAVEFHTDFAVRRSQQ
jgi:hypothetical protein